MIEHLSSMQKSLGLISSTTKNKKYTNKETTKQDMWYKPEIQM
jgi:hypothetical protein